MKLRETCACGASLDLSYLWDGPGAGEVLATFRDAHSFCRAVNARRPSTDFETEKGVKTW